MPLGKRKSCALALIRKKLVASRSVVSAFTSEQRRRSVTFRGEEEQGSDAPGGFCAEGKKDAGAKRTLRPRGADELSSLRSANSVEFRIREIRSDRTFQVLSFLIKNGRPVRWTDLRFLVQVTGLEPA